MELNRVSPCRPAASETPHQTKVGYNQRSQVEAQIGRWKQVIDDRLQARDFDNQTVEAQIASKALNRMTALGRAAYERVF